MFYSFCYKISLCFVLYFAFISTSFADIIHPDVMGETVWFRAISEGSPTNDPLPLYGTPTISGNTLDFPTTGSFAATSEAGNGPDQTDGKLTFMVEAKEGHSLSGILFEEIGLTRLAVPFDGDAFTSIEAFAVIKINQVAGVDVNVPSTTRFFDFDPSDVFQHSIDATGPVFSSDWLGSAGIRFRRPVTKATVTLNNILLAATTNDSGTAALIDKKEFVVRVPTDELIPEPTTLVLGGLFGLIVIAVPSSRWL